MDENNALAFDDGPTEEANVREVPKDNTEHEMGVEGGSEGGGHVRGGGGHVRGGGRGRRGGGGEHGMELGHVRGGGHGRGVDGIEIEKGGESAVKHARRGGGARGRGGSRGGGRRNRRWRRQNNNNTHK